MSTPNKVSTESLPHSLRHFDADSAKDDALALLSFLDETIFFQQQVQDDGMGKEALAGMALVLNLIRDKVAIATGDYTFPFNGGDSDLVPQG